MKIVLGLAVLLLTAWVLVLEVRAPRCVSGSGDPGQDAEGGDEGERARRAPARGAGTPDGSVSRIELNAIDHQLDILDLRRGTHGTSRQIDEVLREYVGDVLFTGDRLVILENDERVGAFLDLGEDRKPDTEFGLFYALRLYKKRIQIRQFPFLDRYQPLEGIDWRAFFLERRDTITQVAAAPGRVALLRLSQRTRVGEDKVFVLRILEFTPGVKVVLAWRELVDHEDP